MNARRIKDTTQAVQRSIDILEAVTSFDGSIGVSALARRIGLSKATTYRLCQTLVDRQFLEQSTQTGEYRLGLRLLRMSSHLLGGMTFARLVRPALEQMAIACRQNTFAGLHENMQEIMICEEVRVDNPVQPRPLLGSRFSILDGPGGLLCLAGLDEKRLESLLPHVARQSGKTDPELAQRVLEEIRGLRGSAYLAQEGIPYRNTVVVCSPVTDRRHQTMGVIGYCCAQLLEDPIDRERLGDACHRAATSLSAILSG